MPPIPSTSCCVSSAASGARSRPTPALAGVLGACDGDLPLGAIVDALADLLAVDAAALRADILPRFRTLIADGWLT